MRSTTRTVVSEAMAMLTTLLPARSVTRRRWGSSRRRPSDAPPGPSVKLSNRWGANEKTAISLLEKNALTAIRAAVTGTKNSDIPGDGLPAKKSDPTYQNSSFRSSAYAPAFVETYNSGIEVRPSFAGHPPARSIPYTTPRLDFGLLFVSTANTY